MAWLGLKERRVGGGNDRGEWAGGRRLILVDGKRQEVLQPA